MAMTVVNATVRLQFHQGFTLDDAIPLVAYFKRLGISHLYASPLLKARAGSMHCYDVVDPSCINPELGGEEALHRLVAELRNHDMGLIVDTVCNHMAVGRDDNPWWLSVLEWGLKSPYAQFFDIQWNSPDPLLKGQLLLPFLGQNYGEVLAAGQLSLHFDAAAGEFYANHFDHRFPLHPPSYGAILRNTGDSSLIALAYLFEALETHHSASNSDILSEANILKEQLKQLASNADIGLSISKALSLYQITAAENQSDQNNTNLLDHTAAETTREKAVKDAHAGDVHPEWQADKNLQRLHQILEAQHYRLASWRTAADDINWRRFFDVNELAGLRVERPAVFDAIHAKIFELIEQGLIDGLRIDHVDGLANPRAYCRKLRRRVNRLLSKRPAALGHAPFPIYVEKILADGENLSLEWKVDGTTGYEFMNQISLFQHDARGELLLFDLWGRISGRSGTFKDEVKEARRLVLSGGLAGDVETVAQGLLQIARTDIATRDLPLGALRRALIELVVHFPVYRTYAYACGRSPEDQTYFCQAVTGARTTLTENNWPELDYIDGWLGGQSLHTLPPGPTRTLRKKTLTRFQQLTSPAAAKAVEDTACYRSAVLLSRNDVGFDPQNFSASLSQFHAQNADRALRFSNNLLATATHDHKRGEDTRARLAVISERAVWFAEKVALWQILAAPLGVMLEEGAAPSPGDELILYQTLLGSWPLGLLADDSSGMQSYLERILRWQEKALREAKLRTSWSAANEAYETANRAFLTTLFTADNTLALRSELAAAAHSLAPAGALNSLSQTLLRMTVPGVADLYQGAEFWDFSLVDPDNRQPVDFSARVAALNADHSPLEHITHWQTGHVKQWLISQTLLLRQQYPQLFLHGDYQALEVEGEQAAHLVAFTRQYQNLWLVVIVPRHAFHLLNASQVPHIPVTAWGDTRVLLPEFLNSSNAGMVTLMESLSPISCQPAQGYLNANEVLTNFSVNFLLFQSSY